LKKKLEMMDVDIKHKKKNLKIGIQIAAKERDGLVALLKEFSDVFVLTYTDIPGLDNNIVVLASDKWMETRKVETKKNEARYPD
jgi:hypothetical protein